MSKSNSLESSILSHIFANANIASIGDATGLRSSSTAGSLYISLHTADPGEAGDQTTNETAYSGYARIAVVRSASGWTVTNDTVVNAAAITFAAVGSGSGTITHFGIGTDSSGAGVLLYKGALTSSLPYVAGTVPQFAAGALSVTEA